MWLTRNTHNGAGVSQYQFAALRICVGFLLVLGVGAGWALELTPRHLPSQEVPWLELPRAVRVSLRLAVTGLALVLMLGWQRRVAALLLAAVSAAFAALEGVPVATATCWVFHLLLLAWPAPGEPWSITPRGAADLPDHWLMSAWTASAASLFGFAAYWPLPVHVLLSVGALVLLASVAVFGPRLYSGLLLPVSVGLAALALHSAALALLFCLCSTLTLASRDWLPPRVSAGQVVIFYDGVCGLCQRSVQLIVEEDRDGRLKLAPLQGATAAQLLTLSSDAEFSSMVVLDSGELLTQSDAALRIAAHLGGAWRLVTPLGSLPRPVRDGLYGWVARNRYAWFGKLDACPVPSAAVRARFLP